MKLLDFISDLFSDLFSGRHNDARQPAHRIIPEPIIPEPTRSIKEAVGSPARTGTKLMVEKAACQLMFIDRAWKLCLWRDDSHFADWKHDLAAMHEHRDLKAVGLEAIGHDSRVIFRQKITFAGAARATAYDCAGGVELPLLDRSAIKSARLLVYRQGNAAAYRHLLRLPWETAADLPAHPGDAIKSDHAAKITGGRQNATLHVAVTARHRLEVTQTGARDYAFARDLDRPITGVFLHRKFAPPDFEFRIGQRLTAQLVTGPKGIQARSIRNA